jgi:hypothetical protein
MKKKLYVIFGLFVLTLALGVTVKLSEKPQEIRRKAAEEIFPWYRVSECDTTIGQYLCSNDGNHGVDVTYITREACVEDAYCIKDISDEIEKVYTNCWTKKTYSFNDSLEPWEKGQYVVGDVDSDGYEDILSLRKKNTGVYSDDDFNYFIQILKNERKTDGSFLNMSVGSTMFLFKKKPVNRSYFVNIGKFSSNGGNNIIIGENNYNPLHTDTGSQDVSARFYVNRWMNGGGWKEIMVSKNLYWYDFIGVKNIDLNDDGYLDIVLPLGQANRNMSKWLIFDGDNNEGLFSGITEYTNDNIDFYASYDESVIAFGDFWGNKKNGVAWFGEQGKINIYANKNNLLSIPIELNIDFSDIRVLAALDLNDDGLDDLAVGGLYGDKGIVELYETKIIDSKLDFVLVKKIITDNSVIYSMISLDFNNDGIEDVLALRQEGGFYIIKGDKNSSYGISDSISTSNGYNLGMQVANFDKKGNNDFVVFTDSSALVFLNTCIFTPTPTPTIMPAEGLCKSVVLDLLNPECLVSCKKMDDNYVGMDKWGGDYNCDGGLTTGDYIVWRDEFFKKGTEREADGDCDGKTSLSDYSKWREEYLK